jgi:hypothetical protein
MPVKEDSITSPNKQVIDDKENYLLSKGFIRVSPTAKKKPGEYSRSESRWAEPSFEEVPIQYSIAWCYEI